jgi:ABC-2 type transport system permease protein
MTAIFMASLRGFLRDRAGLVMTLILPPLVYLLFAAIFGASARGEVDARLLVFNGAETARSAQIQQGLRTIYGDSLGEATDVEAVETAVRDGIVDAGVLIEPGPAGEPRVEVLSAAGRDIASAAVAGQVDAVVQASRAQLAGARTVVRRTVGPEGDIQAVYYAGAVSVMFVFFAAMHGAMAGLDDRRSGLQARLSLLAGGLAPVLAGRAAWLTAVGSLQTLVVFAVALPRLPALAPWQVLAGLLTAMLTAAAAAGLGMALVSACRTRDQAQPLSTFTVLLLAALGGSMAPRFLMPDLFRQLGWATPHAWVIEAYQSLLWRGQAGAVVMGAWLVLAAICVIGVGLALWVERRRMAV